MISESADVGSGGDHRSRLRQELLTRMFDDNVMELLLVIAQHAHAVSYTLPWYADTWPRLPDPTCLNLLLSCICMQCNKEGCLVSVVTIMTVELQLLSTEYSQLSIYDAVKYRYHGRPAHGLLQKPFRTEAPLLMEIFQQVFKGATAAELAKATAPVAVQRQSGASRRANIVRPKGDKCMVHGTS